jgi:hypothetical protein
MVAREERENIITTGTAVTQDWDAAWESDGEIKEDSADGRNRHSLDEERRASEVFSEYISIPGHTVSPFYFFRPLILRGISTYHFSSIHR